MRKRFAKAIDQSAGWHTPYLRYEFCHAMMALDKLTDEVESLREKRTPNAGAKVYVATVLFDPENDAPESYLLGVYTTREAAREAVMRDKGSIIADNFDPEGEDELNEFDTSALDAYTYDIAVMYIDQ